MIFFQYDLFFHHLLQVFAHFLLYYGLLIHYFLFYPFLFLLCFSQLLFLKYRIIPVNVGCTQQFLIHYIILELIFLALKRIPKLLLLFGSHYLILLIEDLLFLRTKGMQLVIWLEHRGNIMQFIQIIFRNPG